MLGRECSRVAPFGGILADSMVSTDCIPVLRFSRYTCKNRAALLMGSQGLGKTVQAIAVGPLGVSRTR